MRGLIMVINMRSTHDEQITASDQMYVFLSIPKAWLSLSWLEAEWDTLIARRKVIRTRGMS